MGCPDEVRARFRAGQRTRLLAFGSSNTEHFLPGMHWFDCLELGLRERWGRVHTCINTGIGGNTAGQMLARFEEDAALYQPHLVLITVGGNDSFPENGVPIETYRANLLELHRRFVALGAAVVFQTYYAPDPERQPGLDSFYAYMAVVREVARETGAGLVDHLARWEPFRVAHPQDYKPLMEDAFHLNRRGNAVVGVDLARAFGAPLGGANPTFWAEALRIQGLMDQLQDG